MDEREARRAAAREGAEHAAALEVLMATEALYVRTEGGLEIWQKGYATLRLPVMRPEFPPVVREAMQRFRLAALDGRCLCGASMEVVSPTEYVMRHADDCMADPHRLAQLIRDNPPGPAAA
ncbi:hypothetical protein [Streptomyces sp. IMTB 1903]|uniref:hypothetical protein n=1 Tax=Streptomyces sp. IMTB 1903 TaxID=1776680 RepID=UPI00075DBE23|nr:hypothetical protein [Streptomyces sp. IMTB 1903]